MSVVATDVEEPRLDRCVECGAPATDLDVFGQCFECSDELVPDDLPVCSECGNDIGPYAGVCLDCLEELGDDAPSW